MPKTIADAPDTLPESAKKLFVSAFNGAYEGSCDGDDECSSKIAWAAVKEKYEKSSDGGWVAKSEVGDTDASDSAVADTSPPQIINGPSQEVRGVGVAQLSMFIHKATLSDGVRRWAATASDTLTDGYGTHMSVDLFSSFVNAIVNNDPIPEAYVSKAWQGGMPYLGVSHYSDLNGMGIVGPSLKIYVDNKRFKAQGLFENPLNPKLVDAAFRSIRADIDNNVPAENRVRISIGFLDWMHVHGGYTFVRKSLLDICPVCAARSLPDVYLKGQIIHFALTRVPVNDRTNIDAWEERSTMTTREQDAASIVGEEAAAELESLESEKKVQARSEAVVTLSDAEEVVAESTPVVKSDYEGPNYYGGALTVSDAEEWLKAQKEAQRLSDLWWVFSDVVCNILYSDAEVVPDKAAAMKGAIKDFQSRVESGAAIMLSRVSSFLDKFESQVGVVQMSDTSGTQVAVHPLDDVFNVFRAAFDEAMASKASRQERLQALQPAMTSLGQAVMRAVSDKPASVEDISDVVARLLDAKLKEYGVKAPETTEQPAQVTQSVAVQTRQVPVSAAAANPVVRSGGKAKVADIVKATVYTPGGAR
jgi:cation transport regulator